jgi:predicted unusual protein kinase regulating ubiquinone biosynthesis (AarF/ABC1/UbiB family)
MIFPNKKPDGGIQRSALGRSFSASMAGARAGGAMALDAALGQLLPGWKKHSTVMQSEAKRFVAELGRLKGTYVKVGQMWALFGEHFLPPELTDALHELEAHTHPLPWSVIEPVIRSSLGAAYGSLEINPTALAAASLAQVHRARIIATGEQIVLKVLYPGVSDTIDSDFNAVVRLLKMARWLKAGRELDDWLEDMRKQLHLEVDYVHEARMTQRMAALVAGDSRYVVPRVYPALSSGTVLALEYVPGEMITSVRVAGLPQARRNQLAVAMFDLFLNEVYAWDLMQTDPNFGNYRIRVGAHSDQLILLDFGALMQCAPAFLDALGRTIVSGQQGDRQGVVRGLTQLGCLTPASSDHAQRTFADFCLTLLEPLRDPADLPAQYLNAKGEYRWGASNLMKRAGLLAAESAASRHFTTPAREFAFVARKLTGVFTFIAVLNAEFNGAQRIKQYQGLQRVLTTPPISGLAKLRGQQTQ